jgi:fructose-6-phosphate aldolase 2
MNILLDTADIDFIRKANDLYVIDGVTTNPSILAKQNIPCLDVLQEIRSILSDEKTLHAQVINRDAKGIIKEAEFLHNAFQGNIYVKIPVIPEGYKAMKYLTERNIKVTATAVFTPQQALMAAKAGASYVAPYVNRIDNISGNGVNVVADIINIFQTYHLQTQVLAASFKNTEQIQKICLAGAQAVTVNEDVFNNLFSHPLTDWSVNKFTEDWQKTYDQRILSDF